MLSQSFRNKTWFFVATTCFIVGLVVSYWHFQPPMLGHFPKNLHPTQLDPIFYKNSRTWNYAQGNVFFDEVSEPLVHTEHNFSKEELLQINNSAINLGITIPPYYLMGRCFNGLLSDRNLLCNFSNSSLLQGGTYLNMDIAIGFILRYYITFQHEYINGAAHAGLIVNWVKRDLKNRAIICTLQICQVLAYVLPSENIINLKNLKLPLRARSLYMSFPDPRNGKTHDAYPIGSFWYFEKIIGFLEKGQDILFLSRKGSKSRLLANENELIEKIAEYAKKNNRSLVIYPHSKVHKEERTIFGRASTIIGLHGGSFSNMVFCRKGTKIIEINNIIQRRDCFAAMALTQGLLYKRIGMTPFQDYVNTSYKLPQKDIQQIISEIV